MVTDSTEEDPCTAIPAVDPVTGEREVTTPDPVQGLDGNDELAFMWRDAGPAADEDATLPRGIEDVQVVTVTDPFTGAERHVYVMKAGENGPRHQAEYPIAAFALQEDLVR